MTARTAIPKSPPTQRRISELLYSGRPVIGWELSPVDPNERNAAANTSQLDRAFSHLAPSRTGHDKIRPDFLSVTCGKLGATATKRLVRRATRTTHLPTIAHLICQDKSHYNVRDLLGQYEQYGCVNFLALRGDEQPGAPPTDGFKYSIDLISAIKVAVLGASVGVAAHLDKHPDAADQEADRRYLFEKLIRADYAITQFGFDPDRHLDLVEWLSDKGCNKPIVPGIIIPTTLSGLRRVAEMNATPIPDALNSQLEQHPDEAGRVVADHYLGYISTLHEQIGVTAVQIFTRNQSNVAMGLSTQLGQIIGWQPAAAQ